MNKSEQLIACLEGEIAKRDARIVELESGQSADMFLTLTGEITQLRTELAALKAQEPVVYIPVNREFLEEIADSLDYDVRDVRDKVRSLLAAPVSEAKAQGVVMPERASAIHGSHDHQSGWNACLDEVARLNAAPAAPAADAYPHGHPLHREVFMALESWTGSDTLEDGVRALIAALAAHRAKGVE